MSDQPGTAEHANTISTAPQIMFEHMGDWLSDSDQRICTRLTNGEHVMLDELSTICHCKLAFFPIQLFDYLVRTIVHATPLSISCFDFLGKTF